MNCTSGEYDADGDPIHPCKACPKGKTSGEGATACTAVPPGLVEELKYWVATIGAVVGLVVVIVGLCCGAGNVSSDKWRKKRRLFCVTLYQKPNVSY